MGLLRIITPTKNEKAADVSPLIHEQFFKHWSDFTNGGE